MSSKMATEQPTPYAEHCRGRLAKYKMPSTIEFIETLPKSAVGKVLRRNLKEAEEAKQRFEFNL